MTRPYAWNPMPHALDVRCPCCRGRARFEFVRAARIHRRVDRPFFEESDLFEVRRMRGSWAGQDWHAALYFPLLHGPPESTITGLPDGYSPEDWSEPQYRVRSHGLDEGGLACPVCGRSQKHVLEWPGDAWFQVEIRGRVLWAFDRETAEILRAHVAATDRARKPSGERAFLRHVPTHFLRANVREAVLRRLDRLL